MTILQSTFVITGIMTTYVRIGIAASMLGVCTRTIRRWDAAGRITCQEDTDENIETEGDQFCGFHVNIARHAHATI
jgi:hypothetical protein